MSGELIAAVSTAPGQGGIGIVRLSGAGAARAAGAVFRPLGGGRLEEREPGRLVYGTVYDCTGAPIDRALATWSRAPHSATGEETAELQCHGSPMVLSLALEALFAQGARQARAGEFTRRAFLGGKLDLIQAEAVADLIGAESAAGVHAAAGQLGCALSGRIAGVYDRLSDLLAHFCAVLDYPDEELEPFGVGTILETLGWAEGELRSLLDSYTRGRRIRNGLACAIVGRPNVGKSSLLNALAGYERAIVTDLPGTTRDTVEERCELGGVPVRMVDTAGIRGACDPVERLGVERSRAAMEEAELILVVTDAAQGLSEEDRAIFRSAAEHGPAILVRNKADLLPAGGAREEEPLPPGPFPRGQVLLSARTGAGLEALGELVGRLFPAPDVSGMGELLTNARQAQAARTALEAVEGACWAARAGMAADAVLTDVEGAVRALGELTGKNVGEDVTDRIFSRFCVGK